MKIIQRGRQDASASIPQALEQLRLRLLDLTGRNRLLNFKHTAGKSLQLVPTGLNDTFARLVSGTAKITIGAVPDPMRDDWVERSGRMVKPEAKEHALRLGLNTSFEELPGKRGRPESALALYFNEELGKHCRKLNREARLAIEETGANMFYLVLGFLEYPDSKDADRLYSAPLVCVPVSMEAVQEQRGTVFKISFTGDEVEENLSLREKLKQDHSVELPAFPEDDAGIEEYLLEIEKRIARLPRWRVRRSMTLALLSFSNMLLVRDLDPVHWSDAAGKSLLLHHPIIKRVFQGGHDPNTAAYGKEYDLDDMAHANYPLIFDADSSQHSAMVDVMEGKSLVIEGPPGTGKSQTITNIIAACLYQGKSVLFVAEKLAALQVVRGRLQSAGLDPFLLELHSNKTSKRQVLDSIATRMGHKVSMPRDLDVKEASLSDKKARLKEHATLLNSQLGNKLGCTVHQILWRADRSRRRLGGLADALATVVVPGAPSINAFEYGRRLDQVSYLARQFAEIGSFDEQHPFWGFYPENLGPNDDLKIGSALGAMRTKALGLRGLTQHLRSRFGFSLDDTLTPAGLDATSGLISKLMAQTIPTAAMDILPNVFGKGAGHQAKSLGVLDRAEAMLARIIALESETESRVDHAKAQRSSFSQDDLKFLEKQGLAEREVKQLPAMLCLVESVAQKALASVGILEEIAAESGLDAGGATGFAKLKAVAEVACATPMGSLHLRHPGLATAGAVDVLERSIAERNRLRGVERMLGERLYLDQEPSDADLRTWVLTLREGDAWYRFLQKPWRVAVKAHRSLQRNKDKVDAATRLADFEQLADLRKAKGAWSSSAALHEVTGSKAVDLDAPLELQRDLARWIRLSKEQLLAVQVPTVGVFNPTTVDESRLVRIRSRAPEVEEHLAVLQEFDRTLGELLAGGPGWKLDLPWTEKLAQATAIRERLAGVHAGLADAVASDETLRQAHGLLRAAHELRKTTEDLAASGELSALLGGRHSHYREEVRDITAAIRYGRAVLDAPLPAEARQVLWGRDAREALESLSNDVRSVGQYWAALRDAMNQLSSFGEVDLDEWILADQGKQAGCDMTLARIEGAIESLDRVVNWSQYVHARRQCLKNGLDVFVHLLEELQVPADALPEAFAYRFHASIAESLFRQTPALAKFNGAVHSSVRREFAALDRELVELRGKQIASKCLRSADPPDGRAGTKVAEKTEMSLLEYLVPQQRPRVPVREMLRRAGESIRELKPCFMMGPQAVAQFLHATPQVFDVIIMDEASQMRPEEAIGAIARGKQLIVVGDPKQLPPTSFFSRSQPEEESQQQMAAVDAESILDVASSHFRPIRSLRWHYRSRHESLIAFSNDKFYRGNLVVFPSPYPRSRGLGVRSHYVTGATYDSQMNQMEAARVVDFVVDHIVHHPDQSLGVVALNIRQRDLIAELLDERLASVKSADAYRDRWKKEGLELFVKNLENVQGDERDSIIISTTYGPPPGGTKPHQNFGPISQQGGWRRLNVLFTRAKSSVLLVTSLKDTDIVVGSGTPEGTKALRDYLMFAATGRLQYEPGRSTGAAPESEFEESVIQALRERGFDCEPQVGVAGFRIDIGVRHPEFPHLYLAGIECDGASYHSGITVRDRDRIRQEILENLGWKGKLWRIWSTEWFRNPKVELRKLVEFLEELKKAEVDPDVKAMVSTESASSQDEPVVDAKVTLESVHRAADTLITDAGEIEVSIGDYVTYKDLTSAEPDKELAVLITSSRTDISAGLIGENTPLAQVLLGAVSGEQVQLRIPGQRDRTLEIVGIKRSHTP